MFNFKDKIFKVMVRYPNRNIWQLRTGATQQSKKRVNTSGDLIIFAYIKGQHPIHNSTRKHPEINLTKKAKDIYNEKF